MSQESRQIFPDADALARAAAVELLRLAEESVAERGQFILSLAGGSTPRKLYTILGADPQFRGFPWDRTQVFFGDERHVPPGHIDSNYLMATSTLNATDLVPPRNIHRIRGEMPDANVAALDYDVEMHTLFPQEGRLNGFPRFDVILLGMGPDGHTASLFPGSKALEEKERWVVANWVEKFNSARITFTYPVLNAARTVLLLVAGADKTDMIHEVMVVTERHPVYPVQFVKPVDGAKIWMLDQAAATRLPPAETALS